jgi:hypothetical protein
MVWFSIFRHLKEYDQIYIKMDYTVLEGTSIQILSTAVKDGMAGGWTPQGGVCYAESRYIQPMVKMGTAGGKRDREADRRRDSRREKRR